MYSDHLRSARQNSSQAIITMAGPTVKRIRSKDGIEWHCERQGTGPDVVLIPSGEGDCENFAKVALTLAASFTVTTFDMPGFSRTTAPEAAMKDLTASKLADQIIGLLNELSIDKATFWGCSSGGLAALALAADHPDRVRNVVVHEVPLASADFMWPLKELNDEDIIAACQHSFATSMCENEDKWNALGPAYHKRLEKNLVTWVHTYVHQVERSFSKEELTSRPVRWTIGSLTPAGFFYQNVVDGFGAGVPVGLLPSRHFPQVTIPDELAKHIKSATVEHL